MSRPVRIIIAGSREFESYNVLNTFMNKTIRELKETFEGIPNISFDKDNIQVVSGGAKGADKLGEQWAIKHKLPFIRFVPKWDIHGKYAGILRNKDMASYASGSEEEIEPFGILIAFWDGKSYGTKNMIIEAKKKNLMVFVKQIRIKKDK